MMPRWLDHTFGWGFLIGLPLVALILIISIAWVIPAHFEARAYEHATGHHVSTWDAMWIELRVQAAPEDPRP